MGINRVAAVSVALLAAGPVPAAASRALVADAVERMDRPAIERLVAQSADVNRPQVDGMTALHWAAFHDAVEVAKLLVRAGAVAGAVNRYGVSPLSLACANGSTAMVERLLDAGADPNTTLPGGETALMTAARTGRIGVVRALLSRGADAHAAEDRRGQTALMWAAAGGHADVVRVLLEIGADFRAPLASGFTPLLFAAREGRIEAARVLLAAGADVDATVQPVEERQRLPGGRPLRAGASALLVAVVNAHFDLAAELLAAGADPNADGPGYTVLHALAKVRKPGVGDNNPAPDGSGSMGSLEFARAAAAHGADVNARMAGRPNLNNTRFNEQGATPFMLAALTADADYMRTLVELGADPTLRNADNSTALMAAAGLGTRSPGEDAGTESEVIEAMQVVLALGADVNAVDNNLETPMHGAAYKNLPRAVEFLSAHGAEATIWNRPNSFGWTPLAIAQGYRFGNFKPSPVTEAAVRAAMQAAGRPPAPVDASTPPRTGPAPPAASRPPR